MEITLPSIIVIFVKTTAALQTHRRTADQANRSVDRESLAVVAHQGLVLSIKQAIQNERQSREAVGNRVIEDDTTV